MQLAQLMMLGPKLQMTCDGGLRDKHNNEHNSNLGGTVGCETGPPQPRLKSTAIESTARTAQHSTERERGQGREGAGTDATLRAA